MRRVLKGWSVYELAWLVLFSGIAVLLTWLSQDNLFGFTVFLSGVFCVVLAAKGNIYTYPVGIYNTLGYAWLALQNGFYGELWLNLLFYMPMNIYGFFAWKKHMDGGMLVMKKLRFVQITVISIIAMLAIGVLGFILSTLQGQFSPYLDAASNVLAITATILMVRRYREQWAAYIILNVVMVTMWSLRAINGSQDGMMMIVMWSAYLINAFYGFYNWTQGVTGKEGN